MLKKNQKFAKYEASMMNEYDYKATIAYVEERGIAKGVLKTAKAMKAGQPHPEPAAYTSVLHTPFFVRIRRPCALHFVGEQPQAGHWPEFSNFTELNRL